MTTGAMNFHMWVDNDPGKTGTGGLFQNLDAEFAGALPEQFDDGEGVALPDSGASNSIPLHTWSRALGGSGEDDDEVASVWIRWEISLHHLFHILKMAQHALFEVLRGCATAYCFCGMKVTL
jgi:hypothetical protein